MQTTADDFILAPQAAATKASMRRIIWSSVIGTAVEWYDFLIYAAASALVFNKLFFPSLDPAIGTIAAFGTYAVGYFARPLGGVIFGHFGDRVGRKAMLAATIVLMGLGTFLIGLLPTYEQIGIAAPIMLVILRFLQGIGIGGEWAGAVLMVVENAPVKRRGLMGSIVQIGNPIGNLAAVGVFALVAQLPEPEFLSWGWRLPFLVSIVLVAVGMYIRLSLHETPAFEALQKKKEVVRVPLFEILTHHRRAFFVAVGLKLSEISYASIAGVFAISYATQTLKMPRATIFNGVLVASALALFSIPLFGWMSDRFGRKTMCYAACVFAIGFAFPFFTMLQTRDPWVVGLAIVLAITFGQMIMFGIGASWYSELFSAKLRYSGASLGFQLGAAISGGLTPFAAASLVAWSGGATWPVSIFLIALALLTLTAALFAEETAGKPLK